jgi:hypothetical protein
VTPTEARAPRRKSKSTPTLQPLSGDVHPDSIVFANRDIDTVFQMQRDIWQPAHYHWPVTARSADRFLIQQTFPIFRLHYFMSAFDLFSENARVHYRLAVDAYQNEAWLSALAHADACLLHCTGIQDRSQVLMLKGTIALKINQYVEAKACYEEVAHLVPGPESYAALACALVHCLEFERAGAVARAGLAFSAQQDLSSEIVLNEILGDVLRLNRQYEAAAEAYRRIISLAPQHGSAHYRLGFILQSQDRIDAAIEHYEQAVRFDPKYPGSRANLAFALLTKGQYKQAWPHFEYRWATMVSESGQHVSSPIMLSIQPWEGSFSNCETQHLLVLAEQGFGDTLQFCRYLPMVLEKFAKVGFVCPKPLQRLLSQSFGKRWSNLTLLDVPKDLWEWDRYISLLSLPMVFGTDLETIPAMTSYLSPEPRATQRFAVRLGKLERASLPRIGVAWAGGHAGLAIDQWRSIRPDQFGALFDWPHACWVSLQKPVSEDKRLRPEHRGSVIDWMDEMKDFADTAALIASLDLVISVDTSVAHLAAAMGKPVWLLNRFGGCWRWFRDRDDSPWYPTVTIFTQRERGNWDEVFERILERLTHTRFQRNSNG